MDPSLLHVVCVYSNPVRYQSRINLYHDFAEHMIESGVVLYTVEHAFGDRPFEITEADNPYHIQLRGDQTSELWLKESLTRAGFRRVVQLHPEAQYFGWIDADVHFLRENWAAETVHALQHYAVVQPWEHAIDLDPSGSVLTNEWGNDVDRSFCAAYHAGQFEFRPDYGPMPPSAQIRPRKDGDDWRSHYGYAWAIRRREYEKIGGLINWLVTGSADYHMALAFAGIIDPKWCDQHKMTPGYRRRLLTFADLCDRHIQRNLGFVPGTIKHAFHGHKKDRQYISRQQIILASKFDPDFDLVEDAQGIPVLSGSNWELRDGLRYMFRQRNEDVGLNFRSA